MNMIGNPPGGTARRLQIFVSDLSATGVVRNAIAMANEASASGYRVRLLTCNAEGVLRSELRPTVAVVRLNGPADAGLSRQRQMQKALLAYRRHSREWKPDIMVSAGNHGHLLSTAAWFGLPGAKVLRFSNDLTHSSPSWLARLWRAARFRLMARLADRLIYVSRAQQRNPLLARELARGKASVIANGVDLDAVRKAAGLGCDHPWAKDKSIPIVLAVGRHVRQKNFPVLLKAFAEARSARPMRLIFLGDGNPAEISALKALAEELQVAGDVAFVPAVANPFPYMASARAFVLSSRWEGSANVLLEAMACGTPVIASRCAGDAEHILESGRFGLLFEPCDTEALAAALLRQTGSDPIDPGDRAAAFDRRVAMRRYVRLFDELAARERNGEAPVMTASSSTSAARA
jgi:glycosyltransferase involved in cell wall biosynthesis